MYLQTIFSAKEKKRKGSSAAPLTPVAELEPVPVTLTAAPIPCETLRPKPGRNLNPVVHGSRPMSPKASHVRCRSRAVRWARTQS